jgi:hypothetical protein
MRPSVLGLSLILAATAAFAGPQTTTYHDARLGFAISYPAQWSVDTAYQYQELGPGKTIDGVSFMVPAALTKGTNLAGDTRLSVEHLDGPCTADRFLDSPQNVHSVTEGDRTYSVATEDGAGAGNRYEESVYALSGTSPCLAVRYFIHYSAIENFDPGTVKAFDRAALVATFDRMRRSLSSSS